MAAWGAMTQPSWIHDLLPPGGKVSVTVAHPTPPPGTTPQPPTVAPGPSQMVPGAMGPSEPWAVQHPNGGAPPPPAPPPPPRDTNVGDGNWWNPYTGKQENIPGMNAQGIITDPNAFWAYYGKYKSPLLDSVAQKAAKGSQWANPIDYQGLVTGNADYQSGLAGINNQRWQDALAYGDPSLFASMGLTPAQQATISENPNSIINSLKRALTQQDYSANSTSAAHGAWSSGARNQDLENNLLDNIRTRAQKHDEVIGEQQHTDQAQRDLFTKIKGDMESSGQFDSTDPEHNQALYTATHKAIQTASANIDKLVKSIDSMHSLTDARNMMHAIQAAIRDNANVMSPMQRRQLQQNLKRAQTYAHAAVMAPKLHRDQVRR